MSNSFSSSSSSSSSSSPLWLYSYIKLRFFNRIRLFLRSKAGRKRYVSSSDRLERSSTTTTTSAAAVKDVINCDDVVEVAVEVMEKELLGGGGGGGDDDDVAAGLQRAVKRLHFGSWEEKEMAAKEIERLAKEDVKLRKLVAELGVVPVLVTMAASDVVPRRRAAVAALIQLANGTYTNKALMVEAGILSKLPKNTNLLDEPTKLGFAELLLTLSSLANTPFPLASSEMVPFLIGILESSTTNIETKESCLGTLCNLSTILDNAGPLVSNGVVDTLLKLSPSNKELSEKALGVLGSLVVTLMGKKAMENSPMVPETLIEILTWEDKPKCQELSAYILMILAHQSSTQREKMAVSGIVPVLLEVSLLGSPLAQKRSLKLLQWFRDERQAKMGPHSGPQTAGRVSIGSPVNQRETQEGKKMMKSLVKQSLHKNMEMITRRANAAGESSTLKSLVISTSSKSLPY
ncbi:Coatomer beta subunit [Trema orientale]|uniref:Coatomer beta subunit n=1 Tax=Trema orientale TaxID=63057 RepID=A0A2P5DKL5_TREOI|nr:Coatomer beta subunit [Trema orientale]